MEHFNEETEPQQKHIGDIFKEFTTPSRVLQSFTNLSNTVIQTALSGQSKFVFEILQNADDAFEDQHQSIDVKFILQDNYLIVSHNGKGFDYNDVERICDYASQIEEVKATDLSKTGYKGLGFKSLFNCSDCIYIYSSGYSFRFDKTYWPDAETKPWQVIPIWCRLNELPLNEKYHYDQPVNFILRLNNVKQLESQLRELIHQPELLLFLHRIDKLNVSFNGENHTLERKVEHLGMFNRIDFYKNQFVESTWLSRTYKRSVPLEVQAFVRGGSRFIYPNKIQNAKEAFFTFALRSDNTLNAISSIRGLCYGTLPTQLHLALPYHINSLFILNLDRTQLHENEWNEFLVYEIGCLQFNLLKDLAGVNFIKNYVIEIFVRQINHTYSAFSKAFLKGFDAAKGKIDWLPAHQGKHLLKLGEAFIDETQFFKQNFSNIRDHKIYPYLINYDVKGQNKLLSSEGEVKYFTYDQLFRNFPSKYYPQLTRSAYINFISFLYERLKGPPPNFRVLNKLKNVLFLKAKNGALLSPKNALLEESENTIPDFLLLNPIDNEYLPSNNSNSIKSWLVFLGARQLKTPIEILRESVLKWIDSDDFDLKITKNSHMGIIDYLMKGYEQLTKKEIEKLEERLLILTESNQYKVARLCYLPDAVSVKELSGIVTDDEKVSSSYDLNNLREFFIHIGVHCKLNPIEVLRKSILMWIGNGKINQEITKDNYKPIIEFIAIHYPLFEHNLTESEKAELKKTPILTCSQVFQRANVCYFDLAVPNVKGLECVIAKNKLVSTNNNSPAVNKFLAKIGVSKKIAPIDVVQRSVLKWIQEGDITNRVTLDNHQDILRYIAENWIGLTSQSGLKPKEKNDLKSMLILTESGTLKAASKCYWPASYSSSTYHDEIPGLNSVVSQDDFVSLDYSNAIINLLEHLGVHHLRFTDIYEKYTDHLVHPENVEWFFFKLVNYWKKNKFNNDKLLSCVQKKFQTSSRLLARNGYPYYSRSLYSSRFDNIHEIDPNAIPLLEYNKLPEDLEKYLGFKTKLDLKCIMQLLKAIEKKPELGEQKTRIFFSTLLQQLKLKDRSEINKYQLSLFSQDNKLTPAKYLYYFIEENASCSLDSHYLKRIYGMSHDETLELADLCGVNTLPFDQEIIPDRGTYDNTLQEFFLERLPFIVVQESKELNEDISSMLKRLYDAVCSIKLYRCSNIYVKYPFGDPIKISFHCTNDLTFYVVGQWYPKKSKIRNELKYKLCLKTNIDEITDMNINSNDIQDWLNFQKEDGKKKFYFAKEELTKLMRNEDTAELSSIESMKSVCFDSEADTLSSSGESSIFYTDDESYIQIPKVIDEDIRISDFPLNEPRVSTCHGTTNGLVIEDTDKWPTPGELEIDHVKGLKIDQPHFESEKQCFKDDKLVENKDLIDTELFSEENSNNYTEDKPSFQMQHMIKDSGINEPRVSETKIGLVGEGATGVDSKLLMPSELEVNHIQQIQHSEKSYIKWLSEKYVFTFLQDYYKNKYPNSQFILSGGIFTLQLQTLNLEIVWLNASGEKGQSYDLMVKKEGEIKQIIDVKSTYTVAENDLFNSSHRKFIGKMNRLATEFPKHKEKYCIYHILSVDNACSFEKLYSSAALYKVMPLKNIKFFQTE